MKVHFLKIAMLGAMTSTCAAAQVMSKPVLTAAPPAAQSVPKGNTAVPRSGPSPALQPDYKIGPYDQLSVTVWKEQTISGTFPVRPDGMISLVLLGDIQAAGVTPMQLSKNIADGLKKYIQDPLVTVTVAAVNSQKIYVVGEVQRVGPLDLTPEMSPLQAISAAGGLSVYANARKAYILRGEPGKQKKIPFDYKKALKGQPGQNITLQTGDTVVVP